MLVVLIWCSHDIHMIPTEYIQWVIRITQHIIHSGYDVVRGCCELSVNFRHWRHASLLNGAGSIKAPIEQPRHSLGHSGVWRTETDYCSCYWSNDGDCRTVSLENEPLQRVSIASIQQPPTKVSKTNLRTPVPNAYLAASMGTRRMKEKQKSN